MSKQKRRRPNPAFPGGLDELTSYAGDLAITSAVRGAKCTLSEKLLIAAMVPTLLKVIRTVPSKDTDELLAVLYPPTPGVPNA
jgi:hypothetical protein